MDYGRSRRYRSPPSLPCRPYYTHRRGTTTAKSSKIGLATARKAWMAAPTSRWASLLLMVLLLFYEVNREDPRYGDRGFARTVAATSSATRTNNILLFGIFVAAGPWGAPGRLVRPEIASCGDTRLGGARSSSLAAIQTLPFASLAGCEHGVKDPTAASDASQHLAVTQIAVLAPQHSTINTLSAVCSSPPL